MQSLCRREFHDLFSISPVKYNYKTTYTRNFTPGIIQHLGHLVRLNLLFSIERVDIAGVDFDCFDKSDLENFVRIVKNMIVLRDVKSIEKFLSCELIPFGEEPPCRHHNREICSYGCYEHKDFDCPNGDRNFISQRHYGNDYTDCTCRSRALQIIFQGINFSSPPKVKALINFLKNVREASIHIGWNKRMEWENNRPFHIDIDTETLKAEIGSLRNTTCKSINFISASCMTTIIKELATITGWKSYYCYELFNKDQKISHTYSLLDLNR